MIEIDETSIPASCAIPNKNQKKIESVFDSFFFSLDCLLFCMRNVHATGNTRRRLKKKRRKTSQAVVGQVEVVDELNDMFVDLLRGIEVYPPDGADGSHCSIWFPSAQPSADVRCLNTTP